MTDSLLTTRGVILLQRNAKTCQENSLWWAIIKGSAIPRSKGNDLEGSGSHVESQQQTALGYLPMNLQSSYPRPTRRKAKPNSAFRRTKEKKLWPKTLNAFFKRPQGTGCLVSALTRWLGLSSASNQILHHWVGASYTFSKILLSGGVGWGAPTFASYLESVLLGFGGQNPKPTRKHQKRREMGYWRQQHPVPGPVFCFNFMVLDRGKERGETGS